MQVWVTWGLKNLLRNSCLVLLQYDQKGPLKRIVCIRGLSGLQIGFILATVWMSLGEGSGSEAPDASVAYDEGLNFGSLRVTSG